jgi:hypothetical protein
MKLNEFSNLENINKPAINKPDAIKLDIPLLIRLLEYAREDAKDDVDLHNIAEQLINLSQEGQTLTMKDYNQICNMSTGEF